MKKTLILSLLAAVLPVFAPSLAASPADDVVALVQSAVDYFKANGKDKTFAAINDRTGPFVKGDLYIFVNDYATGLTLAHGGNVKLVGQSNKDLKDAEGKPFMQMMIDQAQKGAGWVDYKWSNPLTKKIQIKTTYVVPVPELKAFFACGIYKTN